MDKIVKSQTEIDPCATETTYCQEENIRVSIMHEYLVITDLTNALAIGKNCKEVRIRKKWDAADDCAIVNFMGWENNHFRAVMEEVDQDVILDDVEIYLSERKGIETFSPFALERMKPLKETPKKWTVKHAIRALLNGQYTSFKCNGVYSDDYAYDAAVDFHRGEIQDVQGFCKGIIEHKSGWWASDYKNTGCVAICCHSFDSNEFIFSLKAVA